MVTVTVLKTLKKVILFTKTLVLELEFKPWYHKMLSYLEHELVSFSLCQQTNSILMISVVIYSQLQSNVVEDFVSKFSVQAGLFLFLCDFA
jgi:hypothetical protein